MRARTRLLCVAVATTPLLVGCGDHANIATPGTSATIRSVPTTAPPTTVAPTTIGPTTIPVTTVALTTTTTATPTTTAAPLPVPAAVPADSAGHEPVVDLGTIDIPKVGLSADMYEGIRLTTLDRGPGHWPGTALPGQLGNVVVAGHRVSHAKPFRNLDQLVPGDQVIFSTSAGRFVYTVTSTEVVPPDALWIVDQTTDYTATLFACHPPGSTRQRIVVHLALATA
jgi:sortase A